MEVRSTQPGVQFYTGGKDIFLFLEIKKKMSCSLWKSSAGNFLPSSPPYLPGKSGHCYSRHSGFCLETQAYPDAPNQKGFPDCVLRPGQVYSHTTRYYSIVL